MIMSIKAKYNFLNTIHYKYFRNYYDMIVFFKENKCCKYISHEDGEKVEKEANSIF